MDELSESSKRWMYLHIDIPFMFRHYMLLFKSVTFMNAYNICIYALRIIKFVFACFASLGKVKFLSKFISELSYGSTAINFEVAPRITLYDSV